MVGREVELDALDEVGEQALAGVGGSAWIVGEPGVGKSRLLSEVSFRAAARGFAIGWGQGWKSSKTPSYWPWLEILRALLARPAAPLERAPQLPEVVDWVPEQSAGARKRSRSSMAFRTYDAVQSYLRAHAAAEPIALFLDDVHAIDPASLELAEFIMAGLAGSRIAVFASQSDVFGRRRADLELRLSRLARRSERLVLGRLSREQVAEWVEHATGNRDLGVARRVHDASGGNPLFVSELVRVPLLERPLSAGELPATLRALVHERLSVLGSRQVDLLRAAALIGPTFSLTLWADVAGAPRRVAAGVAHEACESGLLMAIDRDRYRFSQGLIAETLVLELGPLERAALHRRAAAALQQRCDGDPGAPLDEIARHLLEAGLEAAPLASNAAERAACQAASRRAFADAALFYERAIEAELSISPIDARRLAELQVAKIDVLVRAGQLTRAQQACARAVELARALRDGALLARAVLALGPDGRAGSDDLPLLLLEQALEWLPQEDHPLGALVRARLASERRSAINPRPSLLLAREAIAMARRLGDERLLLSVIQTAFGAFMHFGAAEERASLNGEAVELAMRLRDHPSAFQALQRLAFDRVELGELAAFEQAVAQCEMLMAEMCEPQQAWVPLMLRSMRAEWEGDFVQAHQLRAEADALRDQTSDVGEPLELSHRLARALVAADSSWLEQVVEELQRHVPDSPSTQLLIALLAAWQGRDDDARRVLSTLAVRGSARPIERQEAPDHADEAARTAAVSSSSRPVSAAEPYATSFALVPEVAVELAVRLGDAVWAQRLYSELESRAGRAFVLPTWGFSLYGLVDHALARLGAVLGRWSDVEEHARHAMEWCSRMRAQPLLARICRDLALIHLRHGQGLAATERAELGARALALALDGERIATSLGMGVIADQCRDLMGAAEQFGLTRSLLTEGGVNERHAVPALPQARTNGRHPTLQLMLEGEYWTVSFAGELCRVQDGRGMQMLAQLAANPGRAFHVLELSGVPAGSELSDAGSMLDARARSNYRRRLNELSAELDEARSDNDLARQDRLQKEAEALTRELARAFGVGGRERRCASAVERARVNVRRRLTLAVRRIRAANPTIGEAIVTALRTGVRCVYQPKH
jgi:hypothetical protein